MKIAEAVAIINPTQEEILKLEDIQAVQVDMPGIGPVWVALKVKYQRAFDVPVIIAPKISSTTGMTKLKGIHVKKVGHEWQLLGETYMLKDRIKSLGGKWNDPQKYWWISTDSASIDDLSKMLGNITIIE